MLGADLRLFERTHRGPVYSERASHRLGDQRLDQFTRTKTTGIVGMETIFRFRNAKLHCMLAAEKSGDAILRSLWLSAADSYEVLLRSAEQVNPARATARTRLLSADNNCTPPLPGPPDR
jgi:hypothetical protein